MLCPVDLRSGAQRGVPVYGVRLRVRGRQRQRGEVGREIGREGGRRGRQVERPAEVRVKRADRFAPLPVLWACLAAARHEKHDCTAMTKDLL